jgi:hypothetical protein
MKTLLGLASALTFVCCAHAQINCGAELQPLQPATLICTGGSPSAACICNNYGQSCHWAWACSQSAGAPAATPAASTDPSIIFRLSSPPAATPMQMPFDAAQQAEQFRQLQLQYQQIQQQTEQLRQQTEQLRQQNAAARALTFSPSKVDAAPVVPDSSHRTNTGGLANGWLWLLLSNEPAKEFFLDGYRDGVFAAAASWTSGVTSPLIPPGMSPNVLLEFIDTFYSDPLNRPIPVSHAMVIMWKKASGGTLADMDADIAQARRDAQ